MKDVDHWLKMILKYKKGIVSVLINDLITIWWFTYVEKIELKC